MSDLTCGTCKHWHEVPLTNGSKGECRESCPQLVVLPAAAGLALTAMYPKLPATFAACGRHKERLELTP